MRQRLQPYRMGWMMMLVVTGALVWAGDASAQMRQAVDAIFVPQPRGAGETLDDESTGAAVERGAGLDLLVTRTGDRISGEVLSIDAGGTARLSGDQYDSQVIVRYQALREAAFDAPRSKRANDVVRLGNRDRIVGTLIAIDDQYVSMNTIAAGQVRIARNVVRSIDLSSKSHILVPDLLEDGELGAWKSNGGSWVVKDGAVTSRHDSNSFPLFAPLEQKGPVTMTADVQAVSGSIRADLIFCASDPKQSYGRNSAFVMFQSSYFYIGYSHNGGTNHMHNHHLGRNMSSARIRAAYDPASGKLIVWLDGKHIGEWVINQKPTNGQFVMINTSNPMRISNLAVYEGIVPPEDEEPKASDGNDSVLFANKDRVSVKQVVLADGEFLITTGFGELRCPADSVAGISFDTGKTQVPRRREHDVLVDAAYSAMTVQLKKLSEDTLTGHADHLGDVTIPRSAIRSIRFNLYK